MYTRTFPYKDLKGNARNDELNFYLMERDVFKLLVELQAVFGWTEAMDVSNPRDLPTHEVVEFYNNLETVLLAAYGVPSQDGRLMNRAGRYEFEESAAFNAVMLAFLTDPGEATKFMEKILPDGMDELVKKADPELLKTVTKQEDSAAANAEILQLRAQLAAAEQEKNS